MGFLGVYTALYDYQPQGDNELDIREGDLLYVLEKSSEDDWWKAKKKAVEEDDDEPVGLIPNNYVEEAQPIQQAKALYDYTRQTDEEVSFTEDAELLVYDTSDPDWTLVGVSNEYGFAPANYIDILDTPAPTAAVPEAARAIPPAPQSPPGRSPEPEYEEPPTPSSHPSSGQAQTPASALAGILHKSQPPASTQSSRPVRSPPIESHLPRRPTYTPEDSDDGQSPPPALPRRPPSEQISPSLQSPQPPPRPLSPLEPSPRPQYSSLREEENGGVQASPPFNRVAQQNMNSDEPMHSPSGYHLYNINEMVSAMGKRKKMPTTLGINVATGTIFISPEKSRDGPQQEWTAEKLSHYSIEGKHVFLDLVRPSKNVDFHAGAKDTAQEIVSWLGEIAGGYKAEGLKEVIAAGAGGGSHKKGQILYDFMAQGDDEVTVAAGDDVIILDESRSEEWWMVRRFKNGREGVVPSSYIEVTGLASVQPPSFSGINAGRSTADQNRLEEARLAKNMAKKNKGRDMGDEGHKRNSRSDGKSSNSKPKPDPTKTRPWTDRTGTFSVDAQFIGLKDGKIHLHKQNGVKIAVPVAKMSVEDLEYVEKATGESLDEDKPLSDIRRRSLRFPNDADKSRYHGSSDSRAGVSVGANKDSDYDWFDLFLKAGVGPHQCERYAQNFNRDSMDESVLPDITAENLRTLGLKEGDILRVMKYLDTKYNRTGAKSKLRNVSFGDIDGEQANGSGGLFSGPGGTLRNNTRKGRPAPPVQANDVVDAKAFERSDGGKASPPAPQATPPSSTPSDDKPVSRGFDDNAWEVKPPKQSAPSSAAAPAQSQAPSQPALTGAMAELSLLTPPLQPTAAPQSAPPQQPSQPAQPPQQLQTQPTGANPSFFSQLGPQQTGVQNMSPQSQAPPTQHFNPQQTGFMQPQQQTMAPRQRPQAPSTIPQGTLAPPPINRPTSAPQNFPQQSAFGPPPLQPQLTGVPQMDQAQVAPPGQSLNDLNQQRFQQMQVPGQGMGQFGNGLMPQQTGFIQQQQTSSPFADPRPGQQMGFQPMSSQPTGFGGFSQQPQQPMQTGSINSTLPPALQPQNTGVNGFGGNTNIGNIPPVPPIPQQPTAAPLQPQKTGPPPPVRFGVKPEAKKLAPQPTGLRANLSHATPSNPFGF